MAPVVCSFHKFLSLVELVPQAWHLRSSLFLREEAWLIIGPYIKHSNQMNRVVRHYDLE